MTTEKTEVEQLREALEVAVAAMEKAKAVWLESTQTPTQCGYMMSSHLRAGLWKVRQLVPYSSMESAQ